MYLHLCLCFYICKYICVNKWAMLFPDSYFIKHVDWSTSLWYLSVFVFLVHNIAQTAAGNMCILDCLNPYAQHLSLPFTISPPQSQTWMADSPRCLGVHSASAILRSCWSPRNADVCPRDLLASAGNESPLNRNIAAILLSFQSFFIILLAPPIQEWPDKSAAQWAVRWRGFFWGLNGAGPCDVRESCGFVLSTVACAADTLSCRLSALRGTW